MYESGVDDCLFHVTQNNHIFTYLDLTQISLHIQSKRNSSLETRHNFNNHIHKLLDYT
jgi:hypothetical protein